MPWGQLARSWVRHSEKSVISPMLRARQEVAKDGAPCSLGSDICWFSKSSVQPSSRACIWKDIVGHGERFGKPHVCAVSAATAHARSAAVPSRSSTGHGTLPEYAETQPLANLLRLGTAALRACAVAALTAQTCGFPKRSQCPTVFFQIQARDEV